MRAVGRMLSRFLTRYQSQTQKKRSVRRSTSRPRLSVFVSLSLHAAVVLTLILAYRHMPPRIALALPGTRMGERMLLSFSPGGQPQAGQPVTTPPHPRRAAALKAVVAAPAVAAVPTPPQLAEAGSGSSGPSGLGDGNIRIALPQFHPRPAPDLSSLPHGTTGNVVVDIVIDSGGKVTALTLVKGLGHPIDDAVLATVGTWVFTPASKDGQVIASEQEILVHYDRG